MASRRSRSTGPSASTRSPRADRGLRAALDRAQADADVRAIRLRGAGRAFCAGYDIDWGSESMRTPRRAALGPDRRLPDDARFVDAYMALWRSPKPVIAQVHGFCVGGGTDFALCSDLIVCAEDCRIGYPPARVWGSPTTAMWIYRLGLERAKRLLLTGDALDGRRAVEWGLACEAVPADELDAAGLALAQRVALLPANQLHMMKLLVNQAYEQMGLRVTQLIGTLLDGSARHTPEGAPSRRAPSRTSRGASPSATRPFGDYGQGVRRYGRSARAPLGAVLASGGGRRIGGDEGDRPLDGRPLLAYAVGVAGAGPRRGGGGGQAWTPGFRPRVGDLGCGWNPTAASSAGRESSMRCGWRPGDPSCLCAVDMPLLDPPGGARAGPRDAGPPGGGPPRRWTAASRCSRATSPRR